jgi:hypothetical protein
VGIGGKGESVWLAWFLAVVLRRFAEVAEPDRAEGWLRQARDLIEAADHAGPHATQADHCELHPVLRFAGPIGRGRARRRDRL